MIHDIGENMTDENLPRLRATRAGNKGVVTKVFYMALINAKKKQGINWCASKRFLRRKRN